MIKVFGPVEVEELDNEAVEEEEVWDGEDWLDDDCEDVCDEPIDRDEEEEKEEEKELESDDDVEEEEEADEVELEVVGGDPVPERSYAATPAIITTTTTTIPRTALEIADLLREICKSRTLLEEH
jgi:hypothetical protein